MKRVAITGMGVISPVGNDLPSFWSALTKGECGIGPITRFDASGMKVHMAAEVKGYDPTEHGIDKNMARKLDPYAQYALSAACEAMAQSGLNTGENIQPERLGVYVGSGIGGVQTMLAENEKAQIKGCDRVSPHLVPMMIANMAAGNIAIRFQAQGPCLPVVTACATSTNAIGEAYRAIRYGYADAIVAGGSEASICPLAVGGFTTCMALSTVDDPLGCCLPFDKRRSGFVMGEGAGVVVLEEYEHAKARGAMILAELCGYGNTCDAHHITAPEPDAVCSSRALRMALDEAGWKPDETLYINAHGTGTALNDSSETTAIKRALGETPAHRAMISSTKSMTGHMLGAAGAVECIAAAMALQTGVVPPTIGLEQADPACDLDYVPLKKREKQAELALSISLGFGGHNACLALRRA